jgi:hypothetical protein
MWGYTGGWDDPFALLIREDQEDVAFGKSDDSRAWE